MEETSKLIFVSCPYSDVDSTVTEGRMRVLTKYLAQQSAERRVAFSPLLMHYCLNSDIELPSDYEFWKNICLTLLYKSDVVHVLTLPGWEVSSGVSDEIEAATKSCLPIHYINPLN
jgi:hypothetical protein